MTRRRNVAQALWLSTSVCALGLTAVFGAPRPAQASSPKAPSSIVAAENEYGNVALQVGGRYVRVTSVESNPNTDPHTYEVSPSVASEVASAQIVIQNGVGYDTFMNRVEGAAPSSQRQVINVQQLLRLPNSTANPHLWYKPTTMPAVATRLAEDLSKLQPAHAGYFKSNAQKFIASLKPWVAALAKFKATCPGTPVATTEPVSDYMLQAAGTDNLTPFRLQADIMNGVDPTPQDITFQMNLFSRHKVKVFVYNQQVTDSLTASFVSAAHKAHIPVVGVYETMPAPGFDYQSWMLAEVNALTSAVRDHVSTEKL